MLGGSFSKFKESFTISLKKPVNLQDR